MRRFVQSFKIIGIVSLCVILAAGCSQQAKTARHLARAAKYQEKQKHREAIIEYMNVLRLDPTNTIAVKQMGMALFEIGDLRTSLTYLQKANTMTPADLDTAWKLGAVFLALGDRLEARRKAEDILKRHRDHVEALVLWAGTVSKSNELNDAVATLKSAVDRLPHQANLSLALGALYVQQKNFQAAEDLYRDTATRDPKAWKPHMALGDLYLLRQDHERAEKEYKTAATLAPVESVARIRLARFQWASQKPGEARAILEAVTGEAPEFLPAWMQLAQFAFSERDYTTCEGILKRILKLAPAHIEAFVLQQRVKMAQGKFDEAIAGYERLVNAFPKFPAGHFSLGEAYFKKGDIRRATSALQKAVELNPDYSDAIVSLAELQIRSGNPDAALDVLNHFIRRHPEAIYAYLFVGSAYASKREYEKAAEAYWKITNLLPHNPQGPYLLGLTLRRQGRIPEAITMFETALKRSPGFVEPLDQLAMIEMERTGKQGASLDRIKAQIQIAPDQPGLYYLLGLAYFRNGDMDQAEKAFLKAIDLYPQMIGAYLVLSQIYTTTHKDAEALARLDKALTINSNDVAALMMKGMLMAQQANTGKKAIDIYQKVLTVNPGYFAAANNLACLYAEDPATLDKAFNLARQARDMAPKDPYVADTLGWINYKRGDFKWALALLQESADLMPKEAEIQYHLGMCHYALGNEQAAIDALTSALKISHDFSGKEQAAEVLALLSLNPNMTDPASRGKVETFLSKYPKSALGWVRLGHIQEQAGDYAAARDSYERAVGINPQFVPGLLRLVGLYTTHLPDFEKAWVFAKQVRDAAPEDPRIADLVAWTAFKRGDHKWAYSLLGESARELPDDPTVQYHYTVATYVLGKTEGVAAMLEKIVTSTNKFPEKKAAQQLLAAVKSPETAKSFITEEDARIISPAMIPVILSDAAVALRKGDKENAQKGYARIVAAYSEFTPAIRELALLYGDKRELTDEEFKIVTRAREMLPQDPYIAAAAGKSSYRKGQYAYACRILRQSADTFPNQADIFYYLGMSQYKNKEIESAKKTLRRALELDPKSEFSETARALISHKK